MAFERGLYVYSHLCQKLKKKYNYATLEEFDDETSRDIEAQNKDPNDRRRQKYKPTLSKPKQYTTLETLINNSLHTIKDKLNLKSQNLFLVTWRIGVQMVISPFTKAPDILVVCSRITLKG
ncbi:hypothetical protein D8674_012874 [Pyrus ussuriensis x Pyrus communis]|uniref:Uncharacterized protein n=1 Tax=Pyrus ussuriensis x Pyrus communis TaxID=2448454 RepID=A0A5N5GN58_9ROSA|nr:hypothetical protein D8674_012874 [Pyrus ussuriensis x Pyrus communis]